MISIARDTLYVLDIVDSLLSNFNFFSQMIEASRILISSFKLYCKCKCPDVASLMETGALVNKNIEELRK